MLEVPALAAGVGADDRDPVGRFGDRDLPPLDQEPAPRQPREAGHCADIGGRRVPERGQNPPLADERRQRISQGIARHCCHFLCHSENGGHVSP